MSNEFQFNKTMALDSDDFNVVLSAWAKNSWLVKIEFYDATDNNPNWRSLELSLLDPHFPDLIRTRIDVGRQQYASQRFRMTAVDPNDHNFRAKTSYDIQ